MQETPPVAGASTPEANDGLDFINPLDEPVNEKSYATAGLNTDGLDLNTPIPEPKFTPPPIQPKAATPQPEKPKPEPLNPEMRNLSKADTSMAASHMAKMILQGYEWVHTLGNKWLQIPERKLMRLQEEGEINLNVMIDYDYGKKIRAGDIIQDYNEQVKDILTVSDEFKQEATPLLEKVLAKRGIGMTDEQMLIYLFGKDLATKSIIMFQQKSQTKQLIEAIKMATQARYAQVATPAPPPPPPPPPPPASNDYGYGGQQQQQQQQQQQEQQSTTVVAGQQQSAPYVEPEEQGYKPKVKRPRGRIPTKKD